MKWQKKSHRRTSCHAPKPCIFLPSKLDDNYKGTKKKSLLIELPHRYQITNKSNWQTTVTLVGPVYSLYLNTITPERAPDIIVTIQLETCHSLMLITLVCLSLSYVCHSLMLVTLLCWSLSYVGHSPMLVTLLCSVHSPHLNQMTNNHNKLHGNQSKQDMGWLRLVGSLKS